MSERVIPSVSIREVAEGLISAPSPGAVVAKLVGTACKGSFEPMWFERGDVKGIKEQYGPSDPVQYSLNTGTNPSCELTLTRAAELLMKVSPPGGVWIQRVGSGAVKAIANAISGTAGTAIFTASESGGWYNNFQFKHTTDKDEFGNATTGTSILELRVPSYDKFDSNVNLSTTAGNFGSINKFFSDSVITFIYRHSTTTGSATIAELVSQWNTSPYTSYFTASATGTGVLADVTSWTSMFALTDQRGTNWSTNDAASPTTSMYASALENLRGKDVYMTIIGGCDDSTKFTGVPAVGVAHVELCSKEDREQMFIFGSKVETNKSTFISSLLTSTVFNQASYRVIKVAPGVKDANPYYNDTNTWTVQASIPTDSTVTLSGGYVAGLVGGLICSQIPDDTPMNKPVPISALEHELTIADQKRLVLSNFFLLVNDAGYRTLRDITCGGSSSPFFHVSTRMAIDEIRRAMRLAGKPWIGTKNNPRNLNGLKNSLSKVLSERVEREIILPGFSVGVESTRPDQIIGVVKVTVVLQVVFYMEFIEITLVLQ